jgi:hypothetical protein
MTVADVFDGNAVDLGEDGSLELPESSLPTGEGLTIECWLKPGEAQVLQCFYSDLRGFDNNGMNVVSLRITEDLRVQFSAIVEILPACEIGTIVQPAELAINPQATITQQLSAEDFTPVTWELIANEILHPLKINDDGLLTFTGTTKCDVWLSGVSITPQNGFAAQIQSAMGGGDVTWSIVSVTPGVLENAATPPSISADGILSMEF